MRSRCVLHRKFLFVPLFFSISPLIIIDISCVGEHNGVVHDIAWAPVMGRSYHLIATASRENCFRVRLDSTSFDINFMDREF